MSVTLDPDRQINPQFIRWLEHGADLGLSFIVQDTTHVGLLLGKNPELAKALEAREREAMSLHILNPGLTEIRFMGKRGAVWAVHG